MNSGVHGLGEASHLWNLAHTEDRRVTLGRTRVIVCGMGANAHTVTFEELAGRAPCSHTNTEVFSFDVDGRIISRRVFRDD